jgi:glycosyltransferase involved in cell wall biosynthesis
LYYIEPKPVTGGIGNVAYYLPKALAKKVKTSYFPRFVPRKSFLKNLLNVYRKFMMKEFDIVHFNVVPSWGNGSSMLLKFAKRRGAHTVLNIHGIIPLEVKLEPALGPIPSMKLFSTLTSCNLVDRIVVNSEYMRNKVVIWYNINWNKIVVIPHGVDLSIFHERYEKLELDGDPAILYVGNIGKLKGVDVLIQAVAKLRPELPNVKLHLVGYAQVKYSQLLDFQLLAKKEGIQKHVVFHGWVAHSMIPRFYNSADFCVFPSRHESFGLGILEAMASGTPIIASNMGFFREILSNGKNGILFKSGDVDALSKAILILHQDLGLRKKISHNASRTIMEYRWENIAERYVSLYRRLCE